MSYGDDDQPVAPFLIDDGIGKPAEMVPTGTPLELRPYRGGFSNQREPVLDLTQEALSGKRAAGKVPRESLV